MRVPTAAFLLTISSVIACGGDGDGAGGAGGSAGSGASGAGGSGASGAGGSGASGAGGSTGGVGGTTLGDAAAESGASDLCVSTTNAYVEAQIDCQQACEHFLGWCEGSACANPYCTHPNDCVTACEVTKVSMPYVNAQWGCATEHATCEDWITCLEAICG